MINAKDMAILFHNNYERLATEFGYITREDTREFNPRSINGRLMIAVCEEVLKVMDSYSGRGSDVCM